MRKTIVVFIALVLSSLLSCVPVASTPIPAVNKTFTPFPIDPNKYPKDAYFINPEKYEWAQVVSGLTQPLDLQNAGDRSNRLFVVEQAGRILILQNRKLLSEPFLNIAHEVSMVHNEQGLLGLAFHPNYAENGYFFVYYINKNSDSVLARFQVSATDPNRADATSEKQIMLVEQPFHNNNGGALAFGPDGYLYWGLGDGGDLSDPYDNSQSVDSLLGKVLRLDVNSGDPYAIPPDNSFANGGGKPEIWILGVRNPWRFSFDDVTGDFYIGDVGQAAFEEVSFIPTGSRGGINLGWDYQEGFHQFNLVDEPPGAVFYDPIFEYAHGIGCAVVGGVVYRGPLPEFQGLYLFADYCFGKIWAMKQTPNGIWQIQLLYQLNKIVVSFGKDEAGNIYIVTHPGEVFTLKPK